MLLFQKRFHEGLVSGAVRLTFRRWDKPHVKPGGRYRCHPIGVLVVDGLSKVQPAEVTEADAAGAGFDSRTELLAYIAGGPGGPLRPDSLLWRIELHHGGDGDRVEGALDERLSPEDVAALRARLERWGDWPLVTMRLIARRPRIAASKLAASLGRETLPFKTDVRKLKKLGLTQSFEVGYEVSPRGKAFLAAAGRKKRAPAPKKR
jgi:hypothetical protein